MSKRGPLSRTHDQPAAYQTQPYCWGSPHWTELRGASVARSVNSTSFIPTVTNSLPITSDRCNGFQHPLWSFVWLEIVPRAVNVVPSNWATITPPTGLVSFPAG